MQLLLLFLTGLTIHWSLGAPTPDESMQKTLIDLSDQLNRVESQLNRSFDLLSEKIDDHTRQLMDAIKAASLKRTHDVETDPPAGRPVNALLIIDVQNDFINGSLALRDCPSKHQGEEVVPVINQLLQSIDFDVVAYTLDWHPTDHISFFDNLSLRSHLLAKDSKALADLHVYSSAIFDIDGLGRMEQTLWPRHCVQNSFGAQIHPDLKMLNETNEQNTSVIRIYKGTKSDIDSYSAFWDNFKLSETSLNQQLKDKNVTQVFVTGLATDWCVYSTASHAIEHGYKTFIVEDACRGVDEKVIKERMHDFVKKTGRLVQSAQVKDLTG